MNNWIPCKEKLPPLGRPVLVCLDYWPTDLITRLGWLRYDGNHFFWSIRPEIIEDDETPAHRVTYWQPLPDPPTYERVKNAFPQYLSET